MERNVAQADECRDRATGAYANVRLYIRRDLWARFTAKAAAVKRSPRAHAEWLIEEYARQEERS